MRQHPARPPNPQSSPASPVKAPAPCTKRSEPSTCLSIMVAHRRYLVQFLRNFAAQSSIIVAGAPVKYDKSADFQAVGVALFGLDKAGVEVVVCRRTTRRYYPYRA